MLIFLFSQCGLALLPCPSSPPLLNPDRVVVLKQPRFIPVHPYKHSLYTHWVYPYNTMQHPLHILGLPHHMQHRLAYYLVQSRPSPAYIPFAHMRVCTQTHTQTNMVFFYEAWLMLHWAIVTVVPLM